MCVSLPARVIEVAEDGTAVVDTAGVKRRISLAVLVLEGAAVAPGDWILSNAGMAVERIDESEAVELLDLMEGGG